MKNKVFFLILMSFFCMTLVQAQSYVFGFSYSGTETFSKGSRTDYYSDSGEGGNEFYWGVQNRSDFSASLSTIIKVDYSEKSREEQRLLTGNTVDGSYEVSKGTRNKPFDWQVDFTFMWDEYANITDKTVWFNYWANDWDPNDYKDTRAVEKKQSNTKK